MCVTPSLERSNKMVRHFGEPGVTVRNAPRRHIGTRPPYPAAVPDPPPRQDRPVPSRCSRPPPRQDRPVPSRCSRPPARQDRPVPSRRSRPAATSRRPPTLPSMLRVTLVLAVPVAAGLVATQLLLPRIAARRLAEELRSSGDVDLVRVRAMPALKLLFGRADSVEIRMTEARAGTGRLADLLDEARGTDRLDARAARARVGPLLARDLRLSKRGDAVRAQAAVSDADLAAALPPGTGLRPVEAGDGELVLEASAGVLGSGRPCGRACRRATARS